MCEPDFDSIVLFLIHHKWIYDFKLTRYIIDRAYLDIPDEWTEVLKNLSLKELAELPFGKLKDDWPSTFKDFIRNCLAYSIPRYQVTSLPRKQDSNSMNVDCSKQSSCCCCNKSDDSANETDCATSCISSCDVRLSENAGKCDEQMLGYSEELNPALRLGLVDHSELAYKEDFQPSCKLLQSREVTHNSTMTAGAFLDPEIRRGMSAKKWHEVSHMTAVIDHVTKLGGNDAIVDVGSGLGYLGHFLHTIYGHSVLGLEGKQGHSQGANERLKTSDSCHLLQNVTCEIYDNDQSETEFIHIVLDWFSNLSSHGNVCNHFVNQSKNNKSDEMRSKYYRMGHSLENEKQTARNLSCESTSCAQNKTTGRSNFKSCMIADVSAKVECGLVESGNVSRLVGRSCKNCDSSEPKKHDTRGVKSETPNVCMVGLHCCGDLTPTMLKYFMRIDWITSLCLVSCCYHRMSIEEETKQHTNFPLSECLKKVIVNVQILFPEFTFSTFCLRLAAQETRARWNKQTCGDHDLHMRNVAFRAVLEFCTENSDGMFVLKKTSRRLAHKANFESFNTYMKATYRHVDVQNPESGVDYQSAFEQEMTKAYKMFEDYFCLIEPLTALQYLLQPVIETLIYYDRKCYLKESGLHGNITPIFDEFISPRNLALIAYK